MYSTLLPLLLAQSTTQGDVNHLLRNLLAVVLYSVLGAAVFAGAIRLIIKLTPFSIRKEIEEDQNVALAIIIGALILGLASIIAAAVHG